MFYSFNQHFPAGICEYFLQLEANPETAASLVFLSSGFGEFKTGLFNAIVILESGFEKDHLSRS